MEHVDILLASYNGSKFISSQILSIIAQDYKSWNLIIHDDGSTDNTIEIIKSFCEKDQRIKVIDDGEVFHSPAQNFLHLLQFSTSEYIFFCDQDDIWFENKISVMLSSAQHTEAPLAVISDGYLFKTPENQILGKLDYRINNLRELLFVNGGIHGSRAMINKAMKKEMLAYKGPMNMHDHLMTQIACSFGKVRYVGDPLFLYRQHTSNVTGQVAPTLWKRFINGFVHLNNKYLVSNFIYECNRSFMETYTNKLTEDDRELIRTYLDIKKHNKLWLLSKILTKKYSLTQNSTLQLFIKACTRKTFNN